MHVCHDEEIGLKWAASVFAGKNKSGGMEGWKDQVGWNGKCIFAVYGKDMIQTGYKCGKSKEDMTQGGEDMIQIRYGCGKGGEDMAQVGCEDGEGTIQVGCKGARWSIYGSNKEW